MWTLFAGVVLGVLGLCVTVPVVTKPASSCQVDDTPRGHINLDDFVKLWYVIGRTNGPYERRYIWDGSVYLYTTQENGVISGLFSFKNPDSRKKGCISPVRGQLNTTAENGRLSAAVIGIPIRGTMTIIYLNSNFALVFECYSGITLCRTKRKGIVSILSRSPNVTDDDYKLYHQMAQDYLCVHPGEMQRVSHELSCDGPVLDTSQVFKRDIERAAELAALELAQRLGWGYDPTSEGDVTSYQTKAKVDPEGSGADLCPELSCWDGDCVYGSVKDSEGCETCECVRPKGQGDPCPELDCGPCAFGSNKDQHGCATCRCKEAPMLSCYFDCNITCEHGYKQDEKGCSVCQCSTGKNPRCSDMVCENDCPNSRAKDGFGCDTCECACPELKCWDGPCEFGAESDKNGCETCECSHPDDAEPCPELECPPCPVGSFKDRKGCETCHCKDLPEVACQELTCALDCAHGLKADEFGCDICECHDKPKECVVPYCENDCARRLKGPDGCEICECDCPALECWDGACLYGSQIDESGCGSCECKLGPNVACPPRDCPPCHYGAFKSRSGCDTCKCKAGPEGTCQKLQCELDCERGYNSDEYGCPICECSDQGSRCAEIFCENSCDTFRMKDEQGCDTCECACQELDCWDGLCKFGSAENDHGCDTCECLRPKNESTCPEIQCEDPCTFGSLKDSSGCPSCLCKSPPDGACNDLQSLDCEKLCPNGYRKDHMDCYTCACAPASIKMCPFFQCNETCLGGFDLDEAGCPICACAGLKSDVCQEPFCENICEKGRVRDDSGCETCECVCDSLECWDGPCLYGAVRDTSGCDTCECVRPEKPGVSCPLLDCPDGPCYYGSYKDREGCDSCRCKTPEEAGCPDLANCTLDCPNGLVFAEGCWLCFCGPPTPDPRHVQCPFVPCENFCPGGYKRDANGCHTCDCECPVFDCSTECENGSVTDPNGCKTCQCIGDVREVGELRMQCVPPICENECSEPRVKDKLGCETCECPCPKLKCWDGPCEFGSEPDPTGCETCDCMRPLNPTQACPFLSCENGPCRHGSYTDRRGCATCKCKPAPPGRLTCPEFKCELDCADGYIKDWNGCPRCECLAVVPPPATCEVQACPNACPNGYRIDELGCLTCECKCLPQPCWDGPCRFGSKLDQYGCPTCDCHRPEFPKISCGLLDCRSRKCHNGFALNRFGCLTCRCKPEVEIDPEPEGSGDISDGCNNVLSCPFYCLYGNKKKEDGCLSCECKPPPETPMLPCPLHECPTACPNGYVEDEQGCQTCECIPKKVENCRKDCSAICSFNYKMKKDENGCEICTCFEETTNAVLKPGPEQPQHDAIAEVQVVVRNPEQGSEGGSKMQADQHAVPIIDEVEPVGSVDIVNPSSHHAQPGYHVAPGGGAADSSTGRQREPAYDIARHHDESASEGAGLVDPWYMRIMKRFF